MDSTLQDFGGGDDSQDYDLQGQALRYTSRVVNDSFTHALSIEDLQHYPGYSSSELEQQRTEARELEEQLAILPMELRRQRKTQEMWEAINARGGQALALLVYSAVTYQLMQQYLANDALDFPEDGLHVNGDPTRTWRTVLHWLRHGQG